MTWSKACEKFAEVIDNQLGRFSNPSLMIKNAKAKADAKRLIAQGEKDAEEIKKGNIKIIDATDLKQVEVIDLKAIENSELTDDQRVLSRMAYQEAKKDNNIKKVVAFALQDIFENQTNNTNENFDEVDEDLISRIFDEAQFVSKEELQKLWAGVLSKSILKPQEVSVDLIDFLRKMTTARAESISKMHSYVFGKRMIVPVDKVDKNLEFWLQMQSLGLVSNVGSLGLTNNIPSTRTDKYSNGQPYAEKIIFWEHSDATAEFQIPCYMITDLGIEVLELNKFLPDYEYLEQVANKLKKQNKNFSVYIADIKYNNSDENKGVVTTTNSREIL